VSHRVAPGETSGLAERIGHDPRSHGSRTGARAEDRHGARGPTRGSHRIFRPPHAAHRPIGFARTQPSPALVSDTPEGPARTRASRSLIVARSDRAESFAWQDRASAVSAALSRRSVTLLAVRAAGARHRPGRCTYGGQDADPRRRARRFGGRADRRAERSAAGLPTDTTRLWTHRAARRGAREA